MSAPVLARLVGVSKTFPRVSRSSDRLRALWRILRGGADPAAVPVLQDIDLEVRRGQSLGIVGQNGAGKSSLLKVLTGVWAASSGSVEVHGSTAALLELGAGFHPEFTGRENIAMAAALMGFTPRDLRAHEEAILQFADIGRYIDEPVKHYSSGMVVRLGFALVAARRPDLLITDEVLAVGDEAFQRKCIRWIEDYRDSGGTLVLVSHSMYHVQKLCQHACWIDQGRIRAQGDVYAVTQAYLASQERREQDERRSPQLLPAPAHEFGVTEFRVNGTQGDAEVSLAMGADLEVAVTLFSRDGRPPGLCVGIVRADGTAVYGTTAEIDQARAQPCGPQRFAYAVRFPCLELLPGAYWVRVHAQDPEGMRIFDTFERALTVQGRTREMGLVRLPHAWSHPTAPAADAPHAH